MTVVILALPALGAAHAPARRGPRRVVANLATVISPKSNALRRHRSARIVIAAPARTRTFVVSLDGRDVSKKFTEMGRRGRRRIATFRGLHPGPHTVFVAATDGRRRQGFDRRTFIVGRRAPSLFHLGAIADHNPAAPVRVSFHARSRPLAVSVRLNGKRIDRAFGRPPRQVVKTTLSATHGLRPGRNRLTVTAYLRDGSFATKTRRFTVARGRPLAGAGLDRRGTVHHVVRLDGRSSLTGARSAKSASARGLSYHWQLTKRPRGSHAVLRHAGRARPTLVPDVPGRYRARLVVDERGGARASGASATASSTATAESSAPDTVEVEATPEGPPIGLAVDTNATTGSGISIGATTAPHEAGVEVVIVRRGDPEEVVFKNTYPGGPTGMAELKTKLTAYATTIDSEQAPYEFMVLLAATAPAAGQPPVQSSAYSTFADAVGQIGARMCSGSTLGPAPCLPASDVTGANSSFSVIGVPAAAPGSAWVAPGDLTGWLQVNQSGSNYTFVPAENVPFHTTTSPTQASVTVGEKTYTSVALPSESFGLMVLALDPYTLAPSLGGVATFPLSGGESEVELATRALTSIANGPPVLAIVQSIGNIVPGKGGGKTEDWGNLAKAIESLGGTGDVFLRLHEEPYALVGGREIEGGQGAESAPRVPVAGSNTRKEGEKIGGTLNGLLSREPDWRFAPDTVDPTGNVNYALMALAENAPVPWPYESDPGHQAANAWIAGQIDPKNLYGLCEETPAGQLCDIRRAYVTGWEKFDGAEALALLNLLHEKVNCPREGGEIEGNKFTYEDCTDMVEQFTTEWELVGRARQFIGNSAGTAVLQAPLSLNAGDRMSATMAAVTKSIEATLDTKSSSTTELEAAALFGDIFGLSSSVTGSAGFPVLSSFTGAIAGLTNLAKDTVAVTDGTSPLAGAINLKASELIEDSSEDFSKSIFQYSHIADLIVSDWGKLQAVEQLATEWKAFDTVTKDAIQSQIKAATLKWFYTGLLPIATKTYNLSGADPSTYYCGSKHAYYYYPFQGTPTSATYEYAINAAENPSIAVDPEWWIMGRAEPEYGEGSGAADLPESLTKSLTAPFDPEMKEDEKDPSVGFYQPWLMRWVTGPAGKVSCEQHR